MTITFEGESEANLHRLQLAARCAGPAHTVTHALATLHTLLEVGQEGAVIKIHHVDGSAELFNPECPPPKLVVTQP